MIVFDLKCGNAHVFEAWFGSSADYDAQRERGLIDCPLCGNGAIVKAAMAPAVPRKGSSGNGKAEGNAPPKVSEPMADLLAAQRRMEAASDYVGEAFAGEARAMHDGDAPVRAIYGEASRDEALALVRDGVAIAPLPFRPLVRSDA